MRMYLLVPHILLVSVETINLLVRNPCFRVSIQGGHKPASSGTETCSSLQSWNIESNRETGKNATFYILVLP